MFSFYRKDVHQIYNKACLWEEEDEGGTRLGMGTKGTSTGILVLQKAKYKVTHEPGVQSKIHWWKPILFPFSNFS